MRKDSLTVTMSQAEREAFLTIIENVSYTKTIGPRIYFLYEHVPVLNRLNALNWLIKNNLTGRHFIFWHANECQGSDLTMQSKIIAGLNKSAATRPIVGKDFVL